jgi:hypothetical protein
MTVSVYLTYGRGTLAQHVSVEQAREIVSERDDAFVSECDCALCRTLRSDDLKEVIRQEVKHVQGL